MKRTKAKRIAILIVLALFFVMFTMGIPVILTANGVLFRQKPWSTDIPLYSGPTETDPIPEPPEPSLTVSMWMPTRNGMRPQPLTVGKERFFYTNEGWLVDSPHIPFVNLKEFGAFFLRLAVSHRYEDRKDLSLRLTHGVLYAGISDGKTISAFYAIGQPESNDFMWERAEPLLTVPNHLVYEMEFFNASTRAGEIGGTPEEREWIKKLEADHRFCYQGVFDCYPNFPQDVAFADRKYMAATLYVDLIQNLPDGDTVLATAVIDISFATLWMQPNDEDPAVWGNIRPCSSYTIRLTELIEYQN